ncbi:hypothetical protein EH220_05845, partial [bacterium]
MNPMISDFVHDALLRGVSREDIAQALRKGGWTWKEINEALDSYVDSGLPLPVPRKRVSSQPKETFLYLMLFAALYTAAFSLGSVLFDVINLAMPQPGETAQPMIVSLRYGIASVIVSFPLFLFMCRVIGREAVRSPGQRISPSRRWLTYLTLFIASISIVADLITLLVRFLEGDITSRFMLKVIVVAVLAGGTFVYYLGELRKEETTPSAEFGVTRSARRGLAGLTAAVLVILGLGFWFAGSPINARLLAQDAQRVRDLSNIARRVEQYYANKGSLPESLAACEISPNTHIEQKADRVTRQPYRYRIVDSTHFIVGATFSLPSGSGKAITRSVGPIKAISPEEQGFWAHGAGAKEFII